MHWFADLMAAIGVVLNGIPQGIMAMGLGFAVFPTTFSFLLVAAINFIFHSVAPVSFQAESLALTGNLGRNTREFTSIIFGGSVIMAIIGGIAAEMPGSYDSWSSIYAAFASII